MYKIAITGKANTGKNTLAKALRSEFKKQKQANYCEYIAFADPIKAMIRIMFPNLPEKYLTGSSKYRSEVIPEVFKDGIPLTVRQLLIDLGTGVGRSYKDSIWLDTFDVAFKKAQDQYRNIVVVTDVRFRNEYEHLKKLGFYQIRIIRDTDNKINHSSETNQESILDSEYDAIIDNNGTLLDLKDKAAKITMQIR